MYLEHLLSEEDRQIRETIKDFTKKEITPNLKKLETDYTLVEKVHQKLVDIGIQSWGYPAEYGGTNGSHTGMSIICEELAKGDGGISLSAGINSGAMIQPAIQARNRVVMDRFVPSFCGGKLAYACLSMGDEAGGADTENPLLQGAGIKTTARLDGDQWVINGSKAWPTHAGIAEFYLTVCNTDSKAGDNGIALIYVPRDTPGLTFGKPESKTGYKTAINGSIYYDNVIVPREYRLVGPGADANIYSFITAVAGHHTSIMALGIAERAFEIVLEYTGTRMGGFKPVRQHSIVAGIIADMAVGLEMMRASLYNLAYMIDHLDVYGPPWMAGFLSKAAATRVFAEDKAVEIVNKGAELLGSIAISENFPYEKCLRDVKVTQLVLGGQQISRYRVARGYYDLKNWI
jgi:alkylation response protein AidB-like acyl-CoA dehydrogenase